MANDSATVTLDGLAEGVVGPGLRITQGEISEAQVSAFVAALGTDEAYAQVRDIVPHKCVDGRGRLDGVDSLGPDAAGGTMSLVIGDALTSGKFWQQGDTASTHATRVLQSWRARGARVGGHDADGAHGGCGCGACDKLEQTLAYIAGRGDELRAAIAALRVVVDDATHEEVKHAAQKLVASHYAGGGPAIIAAMRSVDPTCVETLTGEHNEVAVVINTKTGMTIDRAKVRSLSDKIVPNAQLQTFNVDAWALHDSAEIMYDHDEQKVQALYYATLCYNVAVAAVLSDASLRIIVR